MKFSIDDSAREKTTKCVHDFSCLETGKCGDRPVCDVSFRNGAPVLFLIDTECADCKYRVAYGGSQVCTCPTHYAMRHVDPDD